MDRYGVHQLPDGLSWLLQPEGGTNARNLNVKCPFVVRPKPRAGCPHDFYLGRAEDSSDYVDLINALDGNALTRAFLPFPKKEPQAFFVDAEYDQEIYQLLGIGRTWYTSITSSWLATPTKLHNAGIASNLTPYVVNNVDVKWMAKNEHVLATMRNGSRPLVIVGHPDCVIPSWIKRVDDVNFAEVAKDVRKWGGPLGDIVLKLFMKEEWKSIDD